MIDTIFLIILGITICTLFFYWYAKYSTKSGFALDENKNEIPDTWEKYGFLFKMKNFIILFLGIAIGFLLSKSTFM
ncbi:MAG: hypothetical protein MUQ91_04335 [Flavobacteriaceae bacterium]|jgi:hypothetical protein|nr:hypothetical protein [Candidatus Arcticimaribacter sp.]MDO7542703.1 hypothetical protein [Flavobacteriaceae bacterium]MDA9638610.1 hypothetical protein [Candidatus Arcticimaribacter sp.]MDO7581635.1 hypothetical protein [Flavobacteriaceae bacterium]MDO7590889.1 hypothetical protein [Flavobacteriaceae bacterium]MDO7603850.1 hypothetical protein [Flavobacteriaceae bacterium]|tara:strand:- start:767 stop:994 length:228 start_codon:yes stop_codon:yes gene_type:complete